MSDLPAGWTKTTFGEATTIVAGGTPSSKVSSNFTTEGGIPWITPADLSGYKNIYISRGVRNLTEKGLRESSAKVFPAGSVLFSSRAPIGYVAIAANDVSTNQGFKSFVLPKELNNKFVYFYLRHIKPVAEMMATGTTFKELSASNAAKLPLLVPPFDEQKRIAEKLDSLLARVSSCQTHLERVPQILKRFRQSVLAAAMEGTLSEEWRLANKLEENSWQDTTLDEICVEDRVITYGVIKLGDDIPDGIPCLRTSNVRWLSIDEDGMKRIKPELSESYSRTILQGNEVLVNVRGTLGGVSVVKPHMIGWNVSREVAIAPVNTDLALPKFIASLVASNASQAWLTRKQKGVAYTGINIEDLRQLPVKLPSLEEQVEIVRRVESLFAYAERLEVRYLSTSERVARLTPSLLAKAFRGELVEQDPNDESAEKLLERIVEEKKLSAEKPKRVVKRKEPRMYKMKETLEDIIRDLPKDTFYFHDIEKKYDGDYEELKNQLFKLLEGEDPLISQVFDKSIGAIRFIRRKK